MIEGICGLLRLTVLFLLFALCVAFALNNADFVKLNLSPFGYIVEIRLFLLMLFSFITGSLLTALFGRIRRLFNVFDLKKLYSSRKIRTLENELRKLKNRCEKLKTGGEHESSK
ncbi:MAG: lipopolysaccharide assembly protein LapA domain-containing protein [Rickettsiales bacterium]|jgi:uncharacterized integral membrane protein|nr:lipopolysaccharide assembly protein LapA domain-containing protein [Rickettsiales bacterium]